MSTKKSLKLQELPDYDSYKFSFTEKGIVLAEGIGIILLFSYIFYRSIIAVLFLLPILPVFIKKKRNDYINKQKEKLTYEFREMMASLIAALVAGYSVENAFASSYKDMAMLYGKDSLICRELSYINRAVNNNRNIEDLLQDFAKRSHSKDIKDFADIFAIAKRSGGNLPSIIRRTAGIITDKIEISTKIATIVSAKKYEQSIMNFVPFGIILYIDMTSPGFFNSLYHNPAGVAIMTILIIVYISAYLLAEKITDIKL